MQYDNESDRPVDTGMLGSDAENPGPGRDIQPTEGDPSAASTEHIISPVGMSGADPEQTRLGTQETAARPIGGDPLGQDFGGYDTGMLGSETANPGPGRDTRQTNADPATATHERHPVSPVEMSEEDPERTRLGTQETGNARQ